ncbi:MAG: hypothetical protein QXP36_06455 [Conexivisphaerales archaeon]
MFPGSLSDSVQELGRPGVRLPRLSMRNTQHPVEIKKFSVAFARCLATLDYRPLTNDHIAIIMAIIAAKCEMPYNQALQTISEIRQVVYSNGSHSHKEYTKETKGSFLRNRR